MDWKWLRNGYVAKSESQRGRDFRRILETAGYGPKGDSRATPAFLRSGNGCWKSAGMVMYRSHMHKGLKRNFQLMPGAQWLELLCHHIPDRFEHLVRYVGWYSTRCRGERARKAVPTAAVQAPEDAQVVAARARSAWARLIHKVYEVDPLECPKCGAPMQVIALIDDAEVIRQILEHLGCWGAGRRARRNGISARRRGTRKD